VTARTTDTEPELPHPFSSALKASTRGDLTMLGIVLFFYLAATAILAVSWTSENVGLQMQLAGGGVTVLYFVCIWHSARIRGARATIAFFVLVASISFFAEYMGDNHGWFFGEYQYTGTLGPRIGGVPPLIISSWSVVLHSSFMLVDWLLGLGGERRGRTWAGRIGWSALVALATAIIVCAWDLMADPMSVSGLWMTVLGWEPFWWWTGGSYLPELAIWKGSGGVPISNFVGWVEVPFIIVFVFTLFFERRHRVTRRLVDAVPWLIYGYLYYTLLGALLEMSWLDPGIEQAALIGTFTMGPVIVLGAVKLFKDHTAPAASPPAGDVE